MSLYANTFRVRNFLDGYRLLCFTDSGVGGMRVTRISISLNGAANPTESADASSSLTFGCGLSCATLRVAEITTRSVVQLRSRQR